MSSHSNTSKHHKQQPQISFWVSKRPYLIWFAAMIFYCYQYLIRVSPGIMADDIRYHFSIKAEEFASLGSIYLTCYGLMQIPVGVLIGKVGVRIIAMISIIACIIGSFLTAYAESFLMMQFARALIGCGSSTAFMTSLKTISDNFTPGNRAVLIGMTLTMGSIGAIISGYIIPWLLQYFAWQYLWKLAGILGFIILVINMTLMPKQRIKVFGNVAQPKKKSILLELLEIIQDRNLILYSVMAIGLYAPLSVIADLWGMSFMSTKFNLELNKAVQATTMIYIGLAIGSVVIPWIFERHGKLNNGITWSAFLILIPLSFIIYGPHNPPFPIAIPLIILGILCGSEILCYTAALHYAGHNNSGNIIGVMNTLILLGNAVLQQIVGHLLDVNWNGIIDIHGVRVYSMQDFVSSFSVVTVFVLTCWLISLAMDRRI